MFKFEMLSIGCNSDRQCWVGVLGLEIGERFDAHLFYIEFDWGFWKFDLLWLRPLIHKIKDYGDTND